MDIGRMVPPDDSGSATFRRFCYQARVAFRYALVCAAEQEVLAVIPEHFEDVAILFEDESWQFLQVKTRELSRGPWRLSDCLAENGAFRSLARTCDALPVEAISVQFVACLEGAIAVGDDLERFVAKECTDEAIKARVAERLGMSAEQAERLMPRLRVQPESPKANIDAMNVRRLGSCMPDRPHREIEHGYEEALNLIQTAMEGALLGDDWALQITSGADPVDRTDSKIVNRGRLRWLTDLLTAGPFPLLSRLIETERWPPTQLEEKLLAGGATADVISNALEMRAAADRWTATQQAASLWPDLEATQDLDIRLRFLATAAVARHAGRADPANGAWADLHERLANEAGVHDPRSIFGGDPILLMGRACSLSDQCAFVWRHSNA